jgi:hypothetical protein
VIAPEWKPDSITAGEGFSAVMKISREMRSSSYSFPEWNVAKYVLE